MGFVTAHAEPYACTPTTHLVHRLARGRLRDSSYKVLWPLAAQFVDSGSGSSTSARSAPARTPEGAIDYEELLASADEGASRTATSTSVMRLRCAFHQRHDLVL